MTSLRQNHRHTHSHRGVCVCVCVVVGVGVGVDHRVKGKYFEFHKLQNLVYIERGSDEFAPNLPNLHAYF